MVNQTTAAPILEVGSLSVRYGKVEALHGAKIAVGPGYQVPFAEVIRRDAGVPTGEIGRASCRERVS